MGHSPCQQAGFQVTIIAVDRMGVTQALLCTCFIGNLAVVDLVKTFLFYPLNVSWI
jgi:hypothetical protein